MPAFEHHFMPLSPPLEKGEHRLLIRGERNVFKTHSGIELGVWFLTLDECVRVIAVTLPKQDCDHESKSKWFKQIMENAITAIRLSVDNEAVPLFVGDGFINLMYESDDPDPSYPAEISFPRNPGYRLDVNRILKAYEVVNRDAQVALVSALLAEGQVPSIPPHYRVLSLIRAVELLYPEGRERSDALNAHEQEFAALGISRQQFRCALPQLRTRCAHGRSRGRSNPEPFVGIGYNEPSLTPLLRLLRCVVTEGLKERYGVLTA